MIDRNSHENYGGKDSASQVSSGINDLVEEAIGSLYLIDWTTLTI